MPLLLRCALLAAAVVFGALNVAATTHSSAAEPETASPTSAAQSAAIATALSRAGDNREQIQKALDSAPAEQQAGMKFLVQYMPRRDLKELSADFLLENVKLAYAARDAAPWKDKLPEDVFFNDVLPYANINERRDNWRKDFNERFAPLVKDAKSPGEAAAMLNQKIFPLLKVRYSTQRRRADQAPYESIESGLASCTGLSVLLIDACRRGRCSRSFRRHTALVRQERQSLLDRSLGQRLALHRRGRTRRHEAQQRVVLGPARQRPTASIRCTPSTPSATATRRSTSRSSGIATSTTCTRSTSPIVI